MHLVLLVKDHMRNSQMPLKDPWGEHQTLFLLWAADFKLWQQAMLHSETFSEFTFIFGKKLAKIYWYFFEKKPL